MMRKQHSRAAKEAKNVEIQLFGRRKELGELLNAGAISI